MERNGIGLEETFVSALRGIEGMQERVSSVADIQKSTGPLLVFIQLGENEERCLQGRLGLYGAEYELHALHDTYTGMRELAQKAKTAIYQLEGCDLSPLIIEQITVELAAPDIQEQRVNLFRRTLRVTILYQFKEE